MSQKLSEKVAALQFDFECLYDAARRVVDRWEDSDLADAVRRLSETLEEIDNP